MEYVDMGSWKRKEHFAFFHSLDYPQYNVCLPIDITHFLEFVRENKLSFYYSMAFAVTTAANACENFRYRIREGRVILHEKTHPSFTDITPGDDLFKIVTLDLDGDILHFTQTALEASARKTDYFPDADDSIRDDLVYISCAPWFSFTSISHPVRLDKDESAPRFTWGKYFNENGRVLLPLSIQVSHALADGLHVGEFVKKLQEYLDAQ